MFLFLRPCFELSRGAKRRSLTKFVEIARESEDQANLVSLTNPFMKGEMYGR
jgi:hypothetical protein